MKISAQDEYGLRILIRIAKVGANQGMSISQLAEAEGLSNPYIAKLTRALRIGEFITSTRGQKGGYVLATPPEQIKINDVLKSLGGALFDEDFCGSHSGSQLLCTNSVDCSVRSLWKMVQLNIDKLLDKVTLKDLLGNEDNTSTSLLNIVDEVMA